MAVHTERITILGTPKFKLFLRKEAKNAGVSVSELVRRRCEKRVDTSEDEQLLELLLAQVSEATARARASLTEGLSVAEQTLADLKRERV